jgi:hypothetical protein
LKSKSGRSTSNQITANLFISGCSTDDRTGRDLVRDDSGNASPCAFECGLGDTQLGPGATSQQALARALVNRWQELPRFLRRSRDDPAAAN